MSICISKKHVDDNKSTEKPAKGSKLLKPETIGDDPCEGSIVATLAKALEF